MRNGRRGIRFAFGVRHGNGSNGHDEFNVINLLCSYSPRLLLLRPKTTTLATQTTALTLRLTTPKLSQNGRVTAASPPHDQMRHHHPRLQPAQPTQSNHRPLTTGGREGKARQAAVAWHETRQATPKSTVTLLRFVSFCFISFHFTLAILPTPHHTTPQPAPPHLAPARRVVSLTHPPLPFPSPPSVCFYSLDSLPLYGEASRPVHAWPPSPCCRLQTAERGEPAGTLSRVRRLRLGCCCWCCWCCG
jgi:hypothetical protein